MYRVVKYIAPITISLALGIAAGKLFHVAFYISVPLLLICLTAGYFFYFNGRKKFAMAISFILLIVIGLIIIQVRELRSEKKILKIKKGRFVAVEGMIIEPPGMKNKRCRFLIKLYRLDKDWSVKSRQIKAIVYLSALPEFYKFEDLKPGSIINFLALAYPPEAALNPEQFNYREYLKQKGISLTLFSKCPKHFQIRDTQKISILSSIVFTGRKKIANAIRKSLPEPYSSLLLAIVLGQRKELNPDLELAFKKAGTMHLFAASGLHASIVVGFFLLIFSLFKINKTTRYLLAIPPLILYSLLAGASPSIIRASIMGTLFLLAFTLSKKYNPLSALFTAALIMLIINPYNLFAVSFQLSFTAVLGIILFFTPVRKFFPRQKDIKERLEKYLASKAADILSKVYELFISTTIISVTAQIVLTPILAFYFNKISLISVFGNMILVPMAMLILPVGLIGGLAGMISGTLGRLIIAPLYYPLSWAVLIVIFLAKIPGSFISVPSPGLSFFILYYAFLLILILDIDYLKKHRLQIACVFLIIISIFILNGASALNRLHRVTFFRHKQKAAFLIEKRGASILVIYGRKIGRKRPKQEFEYTICQYLKKRGIYNLGAALIISEDDSMLAEVKHIIKNYNIRKLFFYPINFKKKSIHNKHISKIFDKFLPEMFRYKPLSDKKLSRDLLLHFFKNSLNDTGKFYIINRNIDINIGKNKLYIKPLSPDSPYMFQYCWEGGNLVFVNPLNPLNSKLKALMRSSNANFVVFNKSIKKEVINEISRYGKGKPFFPIFLKEGGAAYKGKQSISEIKYAQIYDLSGREPKKIRWR